MQTAPRQGLQSLHQSDYTPFTLEIMQTAPRQGLQSLHHSPVRLHSFHPWNHANCSQTRVTVTPPVRLHSFHPWNHANCSQTRATVTPPDGLTHFTLEIMSTAPRQGLQGHSVSIHPMVVTRPTPILMKIGMQVCFGLKEPNFKS
jgi:hypothetical protein